jgi:predicted DNA-binding transcriptional regulator YafY
VDWRRLPGVRASRLVSTLLLLQARGRMTAAELAAELEISVRTVYRDIEALSASGVPVYGEAGHDGGYRLVGGYRTRLTGLTSGEAEALWLAGLPAAAADLGLGPMLATAELKLAAALPAEQRTQAGAIRQRFHLDSANWYADSDPAPALPDVVDAVWRQRRIRVHYRRWAHPQQVVRTVDPYGLVLKAGRWYLVAAAKSGIRTYRISQMGSVEVLESGFERPGDFDLAEHWADYLTDFDARRHTGEAVLALSPRLLAQLPDLVEPTIARAAQDTAQPPDAAGRIRVTIPIESVELAAGMVLRLGAEAEVVAPVELRTYLAEAVATLARAYRVRC